MQFKVGDKVKYIRKASAFMDYNDIGIIVGIDRGDTVPYSILFSDGTYWCEDTNIVKIPSKNQQLLFSFME